MIHTGDCENCKHGAILYPLKLTSADGTVRIVKVCFVCRDRLLKANRTPRQEATV